jgi:CRP-like cAMP-binding protein
MLSDVRQLTIFKNLREDHALLLGPLLEPYSCNAGRIILQQGSTADYFHIIMRGRVEITYKPYDGNTITVTHVDAGGLFGWSAVVGSRLYTSSAIAIEAMESTRMRGDRLRRVCTDHPEGGREIMNCLANAVGSRWKDAHEQVQAILRHGMKGI